MKAAGGWRQLRRACAPAAKTVLYRAGATTILRRVRRDRAFAILRYHAVCGPEGHAYAEPGICLSPSAFERHVAYLTSEYRVLPLPEVVDTLRKGGSLPRNAAVITFDDGYADNLAAARVLHRYGATATFYITAGCVSGEAPFWPAEVRELVRRIAEREIRLTAGGVDVVMRSGGAGGPAATIRALSRLFKAHPIRVREALRQQLRDLAGGPAVASPMLTWSELAEMVRLDMTIGAHTITHPNLPNADPADCWIEIAGSRARLETALGIPVTMFSYPNGGAERYMTRGVARMVRGAGFLSATTSRNGFAGPGSDLFALERVQTTERVEDLAFALEVERFAFRPRAREAGN